MPAKSKAQQALASIAKHSPREVYKKNRSTLKMDKEDLQDFAETKKKDLPAHANKDTKKRPIGTPSFRTGVKGHKSGWF